MSDSGKLIEPRTLKGFRDYLPAQMIPRERLLETARQIYRSYGFAPIDTPALEYLEILTGKGSDETDKQLYRFTDHGGREVGLRFDLTVPLARFAAQHIGTLGTPFKRYHMAAVWRGENTQRGRYREFMQCDFDTIGTKSLSADIETTLVIHDLFQALQVGEFAIHLNNRQVLTGLMEKQELLDKSTAILRALDKLAKIGREKVAAEMMEAAGATAEQADQVLQLAEVTGSNDEILKHVGKMVAGNERGERGLAQLADLLAATRAAGVPTERLKLDVAIARGLDYYTGTIYETFLAAMPEIGSVCSGGRYDNLAALFTKQELPGIGASLGLDRLLAAMEQLGLLPKVHTPAEIFLPFFAADKLHEYLQLAAALRSAGLGVEFYPEPKKLGQQLKYADSRGFRIALIIGSDEFANGRCQIKELASGNSHDVSLADAAVKLKELLAVSC